MIFIAVIKISINSSLVFSNFMFGNEGFPVQHRVTICGIATVYIITFTNAMIAVYTFCLSFVRGIMSR